MHLTHLTGLGHFLFKPEVRVANMLESGLTSFLKLLYLLSNWHITSSGIKPLTIWTSANTSELECRVALVMSSRLEIPTTGSNVVVD